jgi:hypothetical protein
MPYFATSLNHKTVDKALSIGLEGLLSYPGFGISKIQLVTGYEQKAITVFSVYNFEFYEFYFIWD